MTNSEGSVISKIFKFIGVLFIIIISIFLAGLLISLLSKDESRYNVYFFNFKDFTETEAEITPQTRASGIETMANDAERVVNDAERITREQREGNGTNGIVNGANGTNGANQPVNEINGTNQTEAERREAERREAERREAEEAERIADEIEREAAEIRAAIEANYAANAETEQREEENEKSTETHETQTVTHENPSKQSNRDRILRTIDSIASTGRSDQAETTFQSEPGRESHKSVNTPEREVQSEPTGEKEKEKAKKKEERKTAQPEGIAQPVVEGITEKENPAKTATATENPIRTVTAIGENGSTDEVVIEDIGPESYSYPTNPLLTRQDKQTNPPAYEETEQTSQKEQEKEEKENQPEQKEQAEQKEQKEQIGQPSHQPSHSSGSSSIYSPLLDALDEMRHQSAEPSHSGIVQSGDAIPVGVDKLSSGITDDLVDNGSSSSSVIVISKDSPSFEVIPEEKKDLESPEFVRVGDKDESPGRNDSFVSIDLNSSNMGNMYPILGDEE